VTQERAISPDAIFQLAYGFTAAKTLMVASELGLFEQLAVGPVTLSELAERLPVPERSVRVLTNAMVALGLVDLEDGKYRNGAVAQTFLSGQTYADVRPMLRFMNHISYPQWGGLEDAARAGGPRNGDLTYEGDLQQIYSAGMEVINAGTAGALLAAHDFTKHQRVLDLGGGTGLFLAAILTHFPHLAATLFEKPDVAALVRPDPRIEVIDGDFFVDPIPADHDAIILANVVHHFSLEENTALFERIRATAAPEAALLLIDFWTDPTHTAPPAAALTAVQFLISTERGGVYSTDEVSICLEKAGWRVAEHLPLNGAATLLVANPS
jgi:hypothetical protein